MQVVVEGEESFHFFFVHIVATIDKRKEGLAQFLLKQMQRAQNLVPDWCTISVSQWVNKIPFVCQWFALFWHKWWWMEKQSQAEQSSKSLLLVCFCGVQNSMTSMWVTLFCSGVKLWMPNLSVEIHWKHFPGTSDQFVFSSTQNFEQKSTMPSKFFSQIWLWWSKIFLTTVQLHNVHCRCSKFGFCAPSIGWRWHCLPQRTFFHCWTASILWWTMLLQCQDAVFTIGVSFHLLRHGIMRSVSTVAWMDDVHSHLLVSCHCGVMFSLMGPHSHVLAQCSEWRSTQLHHHSLCKLVRKNDWWCCERFFCFFCVWCHSVSKCNLISWQVIFWCHQWNLLDCVWFNPQFMLCSLKQNGKGQRKKTQRIVLKHNWKAKEQLNHSSVWCKGHTVNTQLQCLKWRSHIFCHIVPNIL